MTGAWLASKRYPSETYATGEPARQTRTYNPATQARTCFGNALLAVLATGYRLAFPHVAN